MKFVAAFAAIFLIGSVAAQQAQPSSGRALAETLAKRGDAILASTRLTLQELYREGKGHLASALEHQLVLLEALDVDLKAQLSEQNKEFSVHHLHVIEEELLHVENRVSEEIAIINSVNPNHQDQHQQGTDPMATKLVAHATSVVQQAKDAIKGHPPGQEIAAINAEIAEIEKLVKAIQANPNASAQFQQESQQLARHEQTLQALVARATRHSHPLIPVNPTTVATH